MLKQCKARGIAEEELLRARLERAQAAKHRKSVVFSPGDTVFAWRQGIEKKRTAQRQGLNRGQWYGPGVVLGTETSVAGTNLHAGSVVWVVVNGRLWRCAPSQLRHGTDRERAQQELIGKTPWTFQNILKDITIGEHTDVRKEEEPIFDQTPEVPEEDEIPVDVEPGEEPPATRRRIRGKATP